MVIHFSNNHTDSILMFNYCNQYKEPEINKLFSPSQGNS